MWSEMKTGYPLNCWMETINLTLGGVVGMLGGGSSRYNGGDDLQLFMRFIVCVGGLF
jgi:hypothetical protein